MDAKNADYIEGLKQALGRERWTARTYRNLAEKEKNAERRKVLLKLADSEGRHAALWTARLQEMGAQLPEDRESIKQKLWRWLLVQTGTENALERMEAAEDDDTAAYSALAGKAPNENDRAVIKEVENEESMHRRLEHKIGASPAAPVDPQSRLDTILRREHWHHGGGGWLGQAIYGANDGLGSVFGIVSGVAGATAGGPAVLISGLAGMLASSLSMGSGAYLATKSEREMSEAEISRERKELALKPEEEAEELSLFYQLKGVPEEEARSLASRLISQPEQALKVLAGEELGLSEKTFPNPWTGAISATISTAVGAFIPIVPFFFASGYPAVITSFIISTMAHFLIGAGKTIVTGLNPWKSGAEMTAIGLGEALITYGLGLLLGPLVG